MNEADFISALRALPLHPSARGLEDDCAVLELGSETLIITHDMMAEGTHFRADADMADVAWKLVATNLSDLAAKGAEPFGVLLGHSLGERDERFVEGLREVLSDYDVPLLGGDTIAATGPRSLGLTAIGKATHTPVPSRSGALAGDAIYVTGTLGAAMLGFEGAAEHLDAFNRPRPSLAEGQTLAPHVTAMMDVSDGLLLDAYRMATASNCTFDIASKYVPVADEARRAQCMRWGDDYELLFTAPEDAELPVLATKIGHVIAHDIAPLWLDGELISETDQLGYQH
ncbi:thiamine-phosphate kinase [Erythrobacter sp. W53]|uniref:thiamine-phosphate kinase n=1 Tax=Erythrobacter sp. W53 TaxID=3425947 RepID=UPI003D76922E